MPVFTFLTIAPICCSIASNEANPYPSLISASSLYHQLLATFSVDLYGLQSESLGDISMLLVAPDRKSNLVLLNFVGNNMKPQPEVNISIMDNGRIMPFDGPISYLYINQHHILIWYHQLVNHNHVLRIIIHLISVIVHLIHVFLLLRFHLTVYALVCLLFR